MLTKIRNLWYFVFLIPFFIIGVMVAKSFDIQLVKANAQQPALPVLAGTPSEIASSFSGQNSCRETGLQHVSLDGVEIKLCLPFKADFASTAQPTDLVQSGAWVEQDPYQVFSLYTVPYGIRPAADKLPKSGKWVSVLYRKATRDFYKTSALERVNGPEIFLFGNSVRGATYLLPNENSDDPTDEMLVTEWISEAGNRVWILRAISYGEFRDKAARDERLAQLSSIWLTSQNLEAASTSLEQHKRQNGIPVESKEIKAGTSLPSATWWEGDCDSTRYLRLTGTKSYRLGAVFRNLVACGPGGVGTGTYSWGVSTTFGGAGGTTQLEFQCAELPKRYLWLLYNLPPRSANGVDVVKVYDNALPNLKKYANGTANFGLAAGDILSYDTPSVYGHTSIVSSVTWNDNKGNGSYTIIEQNSSASGARTNTITNWWLNSNSPITYILHDSNSNGSCPAPLLTTPADGFVSLSQTANFSWSALLGCNLDGYIFRIKDSANMDSGGTTIVNTTTNLTTLPQTIEAQWINTDLYWGVRAINSIGADWSVRKFRIEPGSSTCSPGADQAALFTDPNYGGTCVVKDLGDYTNPAALGITDNSVSSLLVGANVQLRVCENADFLGTCEVFTSDDPDLSNNSIGNDRISSAKVEHRSTAPATPPSIGASDGKFPDKVQVTWKVSTGATYYEIYRNTSNTYGDSTLIASPALPPYADLTVDNGGVYWYFVKACNLTECSPYSVSNSGYRSTLVPRALAPNTSITTKSVSFKWTRIPTATQYRYRVYMGDSLTPLVATTVASTTCGTPYCRNTPATSFNYGSYSWQVRAYINGAWKAWSSKMPFTVSDPVFGFDSQFNDDMNGWAKKGSPAWQVSSTGLYTFGTTNLWAQAYNTTAEYADFDFSARLMRVNADSAANYIMVRMGSSVGSTSQYWYPGYIFGYRNTGVYSIWKLNSDGSSNALQPWTASDAIIMNGWNTLRVVASGSSMTFYINDAPLQTVIDSTRSSGYVGFGMFDRGDAFDQLKIDWAKLTPLTSSVRSKDVVSAEQQALNQAALKAGSKSLPEEGPE